MYDIITLKAFAKINLFLNVGDKREDGFHEIETVFQPVELNDFIGIRFHEGKHGKTTVKSSSKRIPENEKNLAFKAAELMRANAASLSSIDLEIQIEKHIPVSAGLGGGSSDAAAVLRGINELGSLKFSEEKLISLASELGADVPFFIKSKTLLATGKGEKLLQLKELPSKLPILLVIPELPYFSGEKKTAAAYSLLDSEPVREKKTSKEMIEAVSSSNVEKIRSSLFNSFELPIFKKYPVLSEAKKTILSQKETNAALLSGAGPAIFAFLDEKCEKEQTVLAISSALGSSGIKAELILTETI